MIEELTCPIGHDIFVEPITVPCCGQSFSRQSLIDSFLYNRQCPLCRHALNDYDPKTAKKNVILERLINEFKKSNDNPITIDTLKNAILSKAQYDSVPKYLITPEIQKKAFIDKIINFSDMDMDLLDCEFVKYIIEQMLINAIDYKKIPEKFLTADLETLAFYNKIIKFSDINIDLCDNVQFYIININSKSIFSDEYTIIPNNIFIKLLQSIEHFDKTVIKDLYVVAFNKKIIKFCDIDRKYVDLDMLKILIMSPDLSLDDIPDDLVSDELLEYIGHNTQLNVAIVTSDRRCNSHNRTENSRNVQLCEGKFVANISTEYIIHDSYHSSGKSSLYVANSCLHTKN